MNNLNPNETKATYMVTCCGPMPSRRAIFWGSILVLLGAFGLLSSLMPTLHLGRFLLPAFLLLWGGALLLSVWKS